MKINWVSFYQLYESKSNHISSWFIQLYLWSMEAQFYFKKIFPKRINYGICRSVNYISLPTNFAIRFENEMFENKKNVLKKFKKCLLLYVPCPCLMNGLVWNLRFFRADVYIQNVLILRDLATCCIHCKKNTMLKHTNR